MSEIEKLKEDIERAIDCTTDSAYSDTLKKDIVELLDKVKEQGKADILKELRELVDRNSYNYDCESGDWQGIIDQDIIYKWIAKKRGDEE